jgi:hypothetical protein
MYGSAPPLVLLTSVRLRKMNSPRSYSGARRISRQCTTTHLLLIMCSTGKFLKGKPVADTHQFVLKKGLQAVTTAAEPRSTQDPCTRVPRS